MDILAVYESLLGITFDQTEQQCELRRQLRTCPPAQQWIDPNSIAFLRRVELGKFVDSHPLLRSKQRSAFPLHGFYLRGGVPVRIVYHDSASQLTFLRTLGATKASEWTTTSDPATDLVRVDRWSLDHLKLMYATVGFAGFAHLLNFCDPLSFMLFAL